MLTLQTEYSHFYHFIFLYWWTVIHNEISDSLSTIHICRLLHTKFECSTHLSVTHYLHTKFECTTHLSITHYLHTKFECTIHLSVTHYLYTKFECTTHLSVTHYLYTKFEIDTFEIMSENGRARKSDKVKKLKEIATLEQCFSPKKTWVHQLSVYQVWWK